MYAPVMDIFFVIFSFLSCSIWMIACLENEAVGDVSNGELSVATKSSDVQRRKWISEIFAEAEMSFDAAESSSDACKRDIFSLKQHAMVNQTSWAVRMLESSEWPRTGFLAGKTHYLGMWDECVTTRTRNFLGRYCLVETNFKFLFAETAYEAANEQFSAWNQLQMYQQNPDGLVPPQIYWALCVPSTCQPADVKRSVYRTMVPLFAKYDLTVSVDVDPKLCTIKDEKTPSISFYAVSLFCLSFILLTLLASVRDYNRPVDRLKHIIVSATLITFSLEHSRVNSFDKFLKFFSVAKNVASLTEYSTDKVYPMLYFVNGFVSLFVIGAHRGFFYVNFPRLAVAGIDKLPLNFLTSMLGNILDLNFAISGYLLYDMYAVRFSMASAAYAFAFLFFRWLRKISVPFVILLMTTHLPVYLNDGPLFQKFVSDQTDACNSKWWAVLFAVNNLYSVGDMCLMQTWFTSVDIQLTAVGIIVLCIITRNQRKGLLFVFFLYTIATVAVFITIYRHNLPAFFTVPLKELKLNLTHPYVRLVHMSTFARMGPYLMGFLTAFTTNYLRNITFEFSMLSKIAILSSSCIFAVATYGYGFSMEKSYTITNAIFGSLNRTLLLLPFVCFLCIFFTSGLGLFNEIFEYKILIIYGRLLNCMYLLGPLMQVFQVFSQSTFVTPSVLMQFWLIAGDFVIILSASFIFYLVYEAPLINILKYLQNNCCNKIPKRF